MHPAPEPRQQPPAPIDDDQPIIIAQVHHIHLLERAARGLGVEQPDDHRKKQVEHEEDHVRPPADVGDGDGRDLHDQEVEDPVTGGGQGGGVRAVPQRHELRRVQPGDGEPANGEDGLVEEEEGQGGFGADGGDVSLEEAGLVVIYSLAEAFLVDAG